MDSFHFTPIDPALPAAEQQARLKRQYHAEWGLALARLGGTRPTLALLRELQRYIDGEVSLAELSQGGATTNPTAKVYQAVARRAQAARQ